MSTAATMNGHAKDHDDQPPSTATTTTTTMTMTMAASSPPGSGWSNGDVPPSMFPLTRDGRITLYSTHRRWINDHKSWTRIGDGTEHDAVHSTSAMGESTIHSYLEESNLVRSLIAQLCERFYNVGWATGTGGGCSIRVGGPTEKRPWRIFVAPSGVQKEDMIGDDIFELDMDGNVVEPPRTPNLRQSACTPLWYVVYKHRPNAKCVIHTHSLHAQMATLLDGSESSKTVKITHLEMLKGTGGHAYDDVLEIPIIDNRPTEDLLADQLSEAIVAYPKANAVLVRRHGLYAWGDTWEQAKTQCESFDYLFESAVKMRAMGIDCSLPPSGGTYREIEMIDKEEEVAVGKKKNNGGSSSSRRTFERSITRDTEDMNDDDDGEDEEEEQEGGSGKKNKRDAEEMMKDGNEEGESTTSTKRSKNEATGTGFNNASASTNDADFGLTSPQPIPLVPKQSKILLLDIEGCTTSISSVKDVLFPYVTDNIIDYISDMTSSWLVHTVETLLRDVSAFDENSDIRKAIIDAGCLNYNKCKLDTMRVAIAEYVRLMVKHDVKATGLKQLQGEMWEEGFHSGQLKGHVYPDFQPTMEWCKSNDVKVYIYSSGSVKAQKLLFGHSIQGDLTHYLSGHYDTTTGNKKERDSYVAIAQDLGVSPSDVIFVSDAEAELVAAKSAGIGHAVMSIRPGNMPLTDDVGKKEFPMIYSLLQLCGV